MLISRTCRFGSLIAMMIDIITIDSEYDPPSRVIHVTKGPISQQQKHVKKD